MSESVYIASSTVLSYAFLTTLLASIGFLVWALIGWRTPFRRRRFIVAGALFAATVGTVAVHGALLWRVYHTSLEREPLAEADEQHEAQYAEFSFTRVGDAAPEFSAISDDGSSVNFASLRGKVVALNFFATWCGPCVMELPHLQSLWEEFGKRDEFSMLVVGREETSESVAKFKLKRGFTFPMAADPERAAYSRYASSLIPRTYVISRNGTILYQAVGFHDDEIAQVRKLLNELLDSQR